MRYIALIEIGKYKKGEEVSKEEAEVWSKMYKESPVKIINDESEPEEEKISEPEVESEIIEDSKSSDIVLDDYLSRGKNVVKKNIEYDKLSKEQLEKLLKLEESGKNRNEVVKTLKRKLGEN